MKEDLNRFGTITSDVLYGLSSGVCPCCGKPFGPDNTPDLTAKCHTGPVYVSYWDGYLYFACGTCGKPIGKVRVAK